MERKVLMSDNEDFGAKFNEVVRELDRISVPDDRKSVEAKAV